MGIDPDKGQQPVAIAWKWVVAGWVFIGGIHTLLVWLVFPQLGSGEIWLRAFLAAIPYVLGGMLLGWLTRGKAVLEPFYAALAPAALLPVLTEIQRVRLSGEESFATMMENFSWLGTLIPIFFYVVLSIFGAWAAEKLFLSPQKKRQLASPVSPARTQEGSKAPQRAGNE